MTEDFTTRLRLQLRDAALREEQRGALVRGLRSARPRPAMALGAVAAAVALALIAVTTLLVGSRREEPAAPPGPRVTADVPLADALGGGGATGFGSVWVSESQVGQILRVDPRTRRVTARIDAGASVTLAAGADSIWAATNASGSFDRPLLRIDPRTNRVVARIPRRTPSGAPFPGGGFVTVAGSRVWVLSGTGALLVDPATNRVVRAVRLGGSFLVVDALVQGDELWLVRANDTITRFDARTGRRLGRVPWITRAALFPFADRLIAANRRSVALVDPKTGRASWRTRLGTQLHAFMVNGPRVFVEGADGPTQRERIWQLDARTGRVAGAVTMPQFGLVGILPVGDGVWLLTSNGHAVVVTP
jgi:DNA-binding beta-propeller fold protein YncE